LRVETHRGIKRIEEQYIPAQAFEAEQVLHDDPRVATHPRTLCQGAGNDEWSFLCKNPCHPYPPSKVLSV
jgi:hypothetical protein